MHYLVGYEVCNLFAYFPFVSVLVGYEVCNIYAYFPFVSFTVSQSASWFDSSKMFATLVMLILGLLANRIARGVSLLMDCTSGKPA